jgi:lipopolysaccharide transport system permease protein
MVAMPLCVLMAMLAAFAVGLWLAALNVKYRDVRHILALLTQLWLFVTPVLYPASIVPPRWRSLYALNPMTGVVESFRWSVTGIGEMPLRLAATSSLVIVVVLLFGLHYFRRVEETFADII